MVNSVRLLWKARESNRGLFYGWSFFRLVYQYRLFYEDLSTLVKDLLNINERFLPWISVNILLFEVHIGKHSFDDFPHFNFSPSPISQSQPYK